MRAIYYPTLAGTGATVSLTGDEHHHLSHVLRVSVGESIKLLDGQGLQAQARVVALNKRTVDLSVESREKVPSKASCDVLLLIPKREALDSMLKMAVELSVRRIFLLRGALSQERLPEERRVLSLFKSALEQSNNPWMPELVLCPGWEVVPLAQYAVVLWMDPAETCSSVRNTGQSALLVVGPEGGLASSERQFLLAQSNGQCVSLATPILRAPTALAAGVGWWLARA